MCEYGKQQLVDKMVESVKGGKEQTKGNNDETRDNGTCSSGKASTEGPEAGPQKPGLKHPCGLCCRPMRAKEGVVQCSHRHWMHLKCAEVTVSQAKKVCRGNKTFQCRCGKARPAKWMVAGD